MKRDVRIARTCAVEAVKDFHFREYAPFAWILAAHLLFLILALNLEAAPAMGSVGAMTRLIFGRESVHYPGFYVYLPSVAAIFEAFLYSIPGAVLIPLALIRTMAPMEPAELRNQPVGPRLRSAFLPTMVASLANVGLLAGWQWLYQKGPGPFLTSIIPGFPGDAVAWLVGVVGAYAIAAVFIYVPIVAARPGTRFGEAIKDGVAEGIRLFWYTLVFIFVYALPVLPVLLIVQARPAFIVERMRPEIIPIALMVYAVLISAATYLTYAAAARLHWAADRLEQA
jgi:hypothetical protein